MYFDLIIVQVRPGQTGLLVSQQARPGGQTLTVQRPAQQHMNIVGANTIAGRQGIRQQASYASSIFRLTNLMILPLLILKLYMSLI